MSFDYSIIIPAYNEEAFLGPTLDSAKAAMSVSELRGEVIVVDNASTDRTAAIAEERGARVVFEPHRQISRARNTGGRSASGRFLFFLDADTTLSPELLGKALLLLESGKYYGGGAKVRFDLDDQPWSVRAFTNFWNALARRRSWGAGCFLFSLREAFEAIGGFREDIYAAEEIFFCIALKKWGRKRNLRFELIEAPPVLTSSRKIQKGRHLSLLGNYFLLGLCPFLLRFRRVCRPWYGDDA